jgi:hypothetical protein
MILQLRILNTLKFVHYILLLLSIISLLSSFVDYSITNCMEQDCKYLLNNEGNIQLHPKTGDPLQDCKTTKSDFVVAMETIERISKQLVIKTEDTSNDTSLNNLQPTDCKSCKRS